MDLAAKIKGFRREKAFTQADLADQVGVARAHRDQLGEGHYPPGWQSGMQDWKRLSRVYIL